MGAGSNGPSPSSSSGNDNSQLAYLKKLAADLQAKIASLEKEGEHKLQQGVSAVKEGVQSLTHSAHGGPQGHLGILLMGPPGSGELQMRVCLLVSEGCQSPSEQVACG